MRGSISGVRPERPLEFEIMIHSKYKPRRRRHLSVRRRIAGTALRPRLNVFRSSRYIYAQIIDDRLGVTLGAASSLGLNSKKSSKTEAASEVGRLIGACAKEKGIKKIAFDRGGYLYHGRVKALAEGAREAGLEF